MAAITIFSQIVDIDEIIPKPVDPEDVEREDLDVKKLTPWVFQHADSAEEECMDFWPDEEYRFQNLFDELPRYYNEVEEWSVDEGREPGTIGITHSFRENEIVALPRKSWKISESRESTAFLRSQGRILEAFLNGIYFRLDGIKYGNPRISCAAWVSRLKYVVGGKQYAARPEGAVRVGPPDGRVPVVSFTTWFEGQTWNQFLVETVSVMLGQLATNINIRSGDTSLQDQEVFVVGFFGPNVHIARGFFAADVIARVHVNGPSGNEGFELKFTRGYNLCLRSDWLEATRVFSRLFRYLLSGKAKIRALQTVLGYEANVTPGRV